MMQVKNGKGRMPRLLATGLAILSRYGAGSLLAALAGLWLSRWLLVRQVGGIP